MTRTTTVVTVAGVSVVAGLLAYAAYFDFKRRNDAEFRRNLRKEKKKVDKTKAQSSPGGSTLSETVSPNELRAALERIRGEEVPATAQEKEQYFMAQVGMGEQMVAQGPMFQLPAALHFYRAMRVYPSPVELIVIYEKTVPPPVFNLVMEMTNMDMKERIEAYYNYFPPKSMNVSVKIVDSFDHNGQQVQKKIVVANKDFGVGEVIYKEHPVVAVLDRDLQGKGTHCSHCLRLLSPEMVFRPTSDLLDSVYCSKSCEAKSKLQSHNLLFSSESPLPVELLVGSDVAADEVRTKAQQEFVEYLKSPENMERCAPLLAAKFISRQIAIETGKMLPRTFDNAPYLAELPDLSPPSGIEWSLYDHIERLKFLDTQQLPERETALLGAVLASALPGLESFLTEERHNILHGRMLYNAIGVCYPVPGSESPKLAGRNDKPVPIARPEDQEPTRTPFGTSRQIGSGYYPVSSYIQHSCSPSARPSFRAGTGELHLVSNRPIKAGAEITTAWVDIAQHEGETAVEARQRRRTALARGWRFACVCERCVADGALAADIKDRASGPVQTTGTASEASVGKHEDETDGTED